MFDTYALDTYALPLVILILCSRYRPRYTDCKHRFWNAIFPFRTACVERGKYVDFCTNVRGEGATGAIPTKKHASWRGIMRRLALMKQRLVAVFLCGVLLLYSPVISLFDQDRLWFGVPVLYLYLFTVWGVLVAVMAWITEGWGN